MFSVDKPTSTRRATENNAVECSAKEGRPAEIDERNGKACA